MLKILLISIVVAFVSSGCTKKRSHNARVARGNQQQQPAQPSQAAANNQNDNKNLDSTPDTGHASPDRGNAPHRSGEASTGEPQEDNQGQDINLNGEIQEGVTPIPAQGVTNGNSPQGLDRDGKNGASSGLSADEGATASSNSGSTDEANPTANGNNAGASGQDATPSSQEKGTSASVDTNQEDGLVKLTFHQTVDFVARMQQSFSPDTLKQLFNVRLPQGIDGSALAIKLEGDHKKATYTLMHNSDVMTEMKDIEFSLTDLTHLESGGYKLLGLCIDAQCSVLFLTLYKIENQRWSVNIPVIMAWVEGRYQAARSLTQQEQAQYMKDNNIDPAEFAKKRESDLKEGKSSVPPQLRVMYQLQENFKKTLPSVVNSLGSRMKKDNSIYSARLFTNVKSGSFDWKFKSTSQGIEVGVKIEFAESEKRRSQEYSGIISDRGARIQDKNSNDTLDIYPVASNQFFLMVFENANFVSELPNSKRAIQAVACQILVEEGQTYSECQFLPSTYVLGIEAQEGRIGGPVLINRGDIKNQYTPLDPKEFIKQLNDAGA